MNAQVKEWCRQECIRQHATTPADISGMEKAWRMARTMYLDDMKLSVSHIKTMGYIIDRVANPLGRFRTGPAVFIDGGRACHAHLIESHLGWLIDHLNESDMTPNEFYQNLMWIHPFKDGNGRMGALVYNILNGTIDNPIVPPPYKEN